MSQESLDTSLWSCCRRILTETETELISQKRFNELVEQQKKVDAEIDAQLSRREEDLRLEEEVIKFSFYSGCEMHDLIKSGMDPYLSSFHRFMDHVRFFSESGLFIKFGFIFTLGLSHS